MPKYVNTEELKNIIKSRYYTNYTETEIEDAQNDIVDFITWDIDDMPGVDVVEVKHGKWEWASSTSDRSPCEMEYYCSECNHRVITHGNKPWGNFCSNCCADMREEKVWVNELDR